MSGNDNQLRELRRHYYAAVSWADHVAGKVLDELESLDLSDDTLVVLHSDHGWHLGADDVSFSEYGINVFNRLINSIIHSINGFIRLNCIRRKDAQSIIDAPL